MRQAQVVVDCNDIVIGEQDATILLTISRISPECRQNVAGVSHLQGNNESDRNQFWENYYLEATLRRLSRHFEYDRRIFLARDQIIANNYNACMTHPNE